MSFRAPQGNEQRLCYQRGVAYTGQPGGTDPDNHTLAVLASLARLPPRPPQTEICVVMGKVAPHLSDISAWCQQQQQLIIDTQQMANLMDWAHIAIGAGGVSASERCARGLPSLTLVMAENQRQVTISLAEQGACINLGTCPPFPDATLRDALLSLLNERQQYVNMVSNARAVVDGHCTERVADALQTELTKDTIRLIPMTSSDSRPLWQWCNASRAIGAISVTRRFHPGRNIKSGSIESRTQITLGYFASIGSNSGRYAAFGF